MKIGSSNTVEADGCIISGNRQGEVTVKESTSGEVIRTFEMDEGVVVREVFLLDGGKTVAACQKNHAVFWDLTTGKEISRLNQRIYGFSHDKTKFFTYNYPDGVSLYAYPELTQICELLRKRVSGPFRFLFSPNDRFLVVTFVSGFPSSDKNFPKRNPTRHGLVYTKLFNLDTCEEIEEFYRLRAREGKFSPDSRFYYFNKTRGSSTQSWQFDLITYKVKEISQ